MRGWSVWGTLAGLSGAVAVLVASWASHGLPVSFSPETLPLALTRAQTAIQQHFLHTLALLGVAISCRVRPGVWLHVAGALFLLGIVLFSFGIYVLHLRWPDLGAGRLRVLVPAGGISLIGGWLALALAALLDHRIKR